MSGLNVIRQFVSGYSARGVSGYPARGIYRGLNTSIQRAIDDNSPDDESHGHDTHHPNETVGPVANISNERFSRLESDVTSMKQDVTSMKKDVTSMKISIAVINTQLATLVNDIKEAKANSNRWLFALFGIFILKEMYDRYEGPRKNANNPTPTIPQQIPTVLNIYTNGPNRAQGIKDDNAAGEKAAV